MAAPVNATINVLANTDQAVAQFRSLQAQVASLNKTVSATSGAAVAQQAALNKALMDGANASRMWNARVVPMNTAVSQFSEALDKGRMSLGQYTRYAASQLPGMSRVFKREFDMMTRAAETNVRRMQTQYVALGRSTAGAAQAMALTPTALNKQAAATEIAAQRQMMMNRMIDLGTTKLLNWGKNTQWAGRQLMVGFSIPLAMMGAAAAKAFKEIDQGTISFKRVYGDLQTTTAEMERNLDAVKELGTEYTKYGKSLASTIELSAKVAATGARNEGLVAATEQTIRLATLGLMEYDEALEATVALQTAFQVSNEDLAGTIDFLNVVENETILTMQDMSAAIPRVAPVIKGLGGDVKDLAVFMTALREGGVSAEQGANALKSGLGRLINPTKAAREEAEKYGISIETIVQRNRGDLMGTVTEFGDAISALGQLEQQQVLQKVFGTYQYARLGALFRNLSNDAGQAQRTMELTSMSVEDLAKISERELSKIEEATSVKFQAAIEQLKIAIAPIGETFMKALTPVIDFISKILNAFNDLPDNVKNIIAIVIGVIAGLGPIVLMTVGLIANGIANIGKLIQTMRKFFARLKGDSRLFNALTKEEQEATAAANGLGGATDRLTSKFVGQQKALESLITLVGRYSSALRNSSAAMPLGFGTLPIVARGGSAKGGAAPKGYQQGVVGVPGSGRGDKIPALLEPGESVVTRSATEKYAPVIAAMNSGSLPGFVGGLNPPGFTNWAAKYSSIIPGRSLSPVVSRLQNAEQKVIDARQVGSGVEEARKELNRLKQAIKSLVTQGITPTAGEIDKTVARMKKREKELAKPVPIPKATAPGLTPAAAALGYTGPTQQLQLQGAAALQRGHMSGGVKMPIDRAMSMIERDPSRFVPSAINAIRRLQAAGQQYVTVFNNGIVSISGTLNDAMNQGKATIDMAKAEIGNPKNQVMLREKLKELGMSDDEINKKLIQYTTALNAELDRTAAQVGGGNVPLSRKAMDMAMRRASGVAAKEALSSSRDYAGGKYVGAGMGSMSERTAYARMMQTTTLGIPVDGNRYDRMGMFAAGRGQRSYLDMPQIQQYFPTQARRFPTEDLGKMGIPKKELMGAFGALGKTPQGIALQKQILATQGDMQKALPIFQQGGQLLGYTFANSMNTAAGKESQKLIPTVATQSGHSSPAPAMGKYGLQDGTLYGQKWVQAAMKQLTSTKLTAPVTNAPQPKVMGTKEIAGKFRQDLLVVRKEVGTALKEVGSAFRQIPTFAYQAVASTKPVFESLGRLFIELNPWATKAYDSVKRVLTQISYTWMGLKMTGMEALGKTLEKARTAYELLMSKTAAVWSKVTALPAKAKSAYETAMIRTMLAWDAVKRMPAQMTNAVSTFMSDLPRNLQRLRNQVFYRGQDIAGRVSERLRPVRERLARVRDSFRTAGTVAMNPVPRALAIATANMVAQEKVTAALGRVTQAIDPVREKFAQITGVFAQGAQKISTAIQFMSDPLARAVAIEVARQKISQQFNKGITAIATRLQPLKNGFDAFVTATKNTATRISRFAQLMMDPLGRAVVISTVSKRIGDTLSNAATSIRAAATRFYESILWGSIKTIMGYESAAAALKAGITKVQSGIISGFNSATQAIRAGATKVYEAFLWGSIQTITGIEKSWSAIKMATTRKWTEVLMAINASGIRTAFNDAWKGIKGAAIQGASNIKDSLVKAGTAIKDAGIAIKTAGVTAAQMVKSVGMALGSGAAGVGRGVSGWLGTVNEKTGRTRGQSIGTASNSAVMGLMGLSMAASFAGGSVGEMAQKIMPVTMGIMGLQMVLPMLTSKTGLAMLAVAALVGGFIYLRTQLDNAAKEAANLGANMGGVANGMKVIEEATGFQAPDIKDRLFRFSDEDREAMAEFGSYFESEAGSKFIQDLKESSSEERYQKVSRLLIQAVASGLDEEKAKSFGYAIAEATGDALLKSSIARDFANQIFGGGSQALIDLEEQRFAERPDLLNVEKPDYSKLSGIGMLGNIQTPFMGAPESPMDAAIRAGTTGGAVGGMLGVAGVMAAGGLAASSTGVGAVVGVPLAVAAGFVALGAALVGVTAGAKAYYDATQEQERVLRETAKGLGHAIQTTQNLANAEAVLEEERRSGEIDFPEYESRLSKIRTLQDNMSEYIGQIFSMGADAGAMAQALGDQLSMAGFSEDQIKRITERFSPDALAKQFFGEEFTFETLGENERKYVEDVLTRVLSGLSPENAEQRLQDIEGTYKDMASKAVQAMADGTMEGLGGLDFFFNKENITTFIQERMGGSYYKDLNTGFTPDQLSTNLLNADMDLKALEGGGTDALEVFTRLAEFTDQNLAKSIMSSDEAIMKFGKSLIALKDYESINLELVTEQDINVDQLVEGLEKIKDFKFDKKIFGDNAKEIQRTALSADQFGKILVDTGKAAGMTGIEIENAYSDAMGTYNELLNEVGTNKLGNIKITPELVPTIFGDDVTNANEIYNALSAAMPDGLPSIQAQILISALANDPITAALLANPKVLEAVMAGETEYEVPFYSAGKGGVVKTEIPEQLKPLAGLFSTYGGNKTSLTPPINDDRDTGTTGSSGEKEKTALEELEESIAERAALYISVTKRGKNLDKAKKGYLNQLAAQTTTNNSIASQLAKLNISETLIADILALGSEKAAEIIKQLGPNGLRRLNIADIVGRAGQFLEGQRSERKKAEYKNIARTRLEQAGGFTEEEIQNILEDEEATAILATLPKKYTKLWEKFIQSLRDTAAATADVKTEAEKADEAFDKASDRLSVLTDMMRQGFDAAEMEAADKVASKFFTDNTKLAQGLAKSTGHTIENGYQLVEAMERQVSLNERLIDQEQDKIDKKQEEINDYERTNSLIQQGIEDLRRQDETRNRRSESLSKDLEQISQAEEKIRKQYQDRIDALDKVSKINDHLIQQQQKQLNLSRAISEGDIYAATQAAQEMRAASAQQAAEQTRIGLERGMESEIGNLTNADGMTRAQIEEEINNIKEQNYQNSLLIRIEEDKIYKNSLEIRRLSNEIYDIQEDIIEPLQNQNKEYGRMLDYYKQDSDYQISRVTLAGMTRDQFEKQADALALSVKNARDLDPELLTLVGRYDAIANSARAAAAEAAKLGTGIAADQYTGPVVGDSSVGFTGMDFTGMDFTGIDFSALANLDLGGLGFGFNNAGGLIKKYIRGGSVLGDGTRDSVASMLTPGEYVIRKAMVDKYGTPLMNALNQGSFNMPTYNTGPEVPEVGAITNTTVSSINAPVYNTYDMKFSISGTNQSADEIANKVMFKMKQIQGQGIRSNRGF